MTSISIYQDGDRFIIGRPEWQRSTSLTRGVAETYSLAEAKKVAAEMAAKPAGELDAMMQYYDTWDRFEMACDAGAFGPAWE